MLLDTLRLVEVFAAPGAVCIMYLQPGLTEIFWSPKKATGPGNFRHLGYVSVFGRDLSMGQPRKSEICPCYELGLIDLADEPTALRKLEAFSKIFEWF